jgi:hypothetical protein
MRAEAGEKTNINRAIVIKALETLNMVASPAI